MNTSHLWKAGLVLGSMALVGGALLLSTSCHSGRYPANAPVPVSGLRYAPQSMEGVGDELMSRARSSEMDSIVRMSARNPEQREESNTERYDFIQETPFLRATESPLSTFAVDVDTASYSNVRRYLEDGRMPPPGAVRVEELLNYFPYEYDQPNGQDPLAVNAEVFGCPWNAAHRLVRVGVQGRYQHQADRSPANLVFLLDVSGSMNDLNKLPLLKRSLGMLVENLSSRDRVAVVMYAGSSGVALPSTSCDSKDAILSAIDRLRAGGSTNGAAGIQLAYQIAQENFIPGGINRVLLATDGDFNVGVSNQSELVRMAQDKAKSGVFLTVLGFGGGNLNDATMQELADRGNGHYAYIDSAFEARKVLVEELGSTLEVIAKDVKIQVEFNPVQVLGYRLIGYENRRLADRDFDDDTKDAGEIGAGHRVTALYEVIPAGRSLALPGETDLKYQQDRPLSGEAFAGELMHVKLRYQEPQGSPSELIELAVRDTGQDFHLASVDARFASSVAAFGLVLRDSEFRGQANFSQVRDWATQSLGEDEGGYRRAFLDLIDAAARIDG